MEGIRNVRPVESTQAYNQYEPVFDRSFGRAYPSRPDTIASMAKTGAKRLFIVTVILGLLYALYELITRRSSSGSPSPSSAEPREGERKERFNRKELDRIRPIKTTFNDATDVSASTVVIPKDNPPVIYDPSHTNKANAEILASYQRITTVADQSNTV